MKLVPMMKEWTFGWEELLFDILQLILKLNSLGWWKSRNELSCKYDENYVLKEFRQTFREYKIDLAMRWDFGDITLFARRTRFSWQESIYIPWWSRQYRSQKCCKSCWSLARRMERILLCNESRYSSSSSAQSSKYRRMLLKSNRPIAIKRLS